MTEVLFYILEHNHLPKAQELQSCELIERFYQEKRRVYVQLATYEEASKFNSQLWTFADISFVPHELVDQFTGNAPVVIGYGQDLEAKLPREVLINLTQAIPPCYQEFELLVEIVPNEAQAKAAARERFKIYRQQQLEIKTLRI